MLHSYFFHIYSHYFTVALCFDYATVTLCKTNATISLCSHYVIHVLLSHYRIVVFSYIVLSLRTAEAKYVYCAGCVADCAYTKSNLRIFKYICWARWVARCSNTCSRVGDWLDIEIHVLGYVYG